MSTLMVSESGIRGVVGQTLTADLVLSIAAAFGVGRQNVVVATDTRPSRFILKLATFSGLLATGSVPVDGGILTTPTVQIAVQDFAHEGGIVITASHNPGDWNALKLLGNDGLFLSRDAVQKIYKTVIQNEIRWQTNSFRQAIAKSYDLAEHHIRRILQVVNTESIRAKGFRVVVDTSNGAGGDIAAKLLSRLNCEVHVLHDVGAQVHYPYENREAHFSRLRNAVSEIGVDIGFGLDPDGDRLTLVDEKGTLHREDFTLAFVVDNHISKKAGPIVVNESTSEVLTELAKSYDVPIHRAAVGASNVVDGMKRTNATIGGEGNGGVIFPELHFGRDAVAAMAFVLEALAVGNQPLSARLQSYEKWKSWRGTFSDSEEKIGAFCSRIIGRLTEEPASSGRFFRAADRSWVSVRPSNTEPIIRVIAESTSKEFLSMISETSKSVFTVSHDKENKNE